MKLTVYFDLYSIILVLTLELGTLDLIRTELAQ